MCMRCGYLPMSTGPYLLPKLHIHRSIVDFKDIHIHKSCRKKAKRYTISIDQDIDGVIAGCVEQHGDNWLYPKLRAAFKEFFHAGEVNNCQIVSVELWKEVDAHEEGAIGTHGIVIGEGLGTQPYAVSSESITDSKAGPSTSVKDRHLVAGELGYRGEYKMHIYSFISNTSNNII